MRLMKKGITPGRIIRFFGILIAAFWVLAGFLYWRYQFTKTFLVLAVIATLVNGALFVFGIRTAQKDGFLDGYARAKDHFDKKKKG